jgi:hypothetical protein
MTTIQEKHGREFVSRGKVMNSLGEKRRERQPQKEPVPKATRKHYFGLFVVSFASLFWELFLIRWLPAELPFVSYFRSLIILAAFLGMGLGCLLCTRLRLSNRLLVNLFLVGICCLFLIVALGGNELRWRGFGKAWGILQQGTRGSIEAVPEFTMEFMGGKGKGELVVVAAFMFISVLFVPIGLIIARYFEILPPIAAYAVNIGAALLGTLVFLPLSFAQTGPGLWSLIGIGSLLVFLKPTHLSSDTARYLVPGFALTVIALAAVFVPNHDNNVLWSPYQRVSWMPLYHERQKSEGWGTRWDLIRGIIRVNHEYHQQIVNLAAFSSLEELLEFSDSIGDDPNVGDSLVGFSRRYYQPYQYIKPKSVLIIAAGNGNEAAAAIRHGAEEIDAVEIDPGIIEVGRRYHPESPYHSPKVRVVCDDARAFLQRTNKKYDLIVMNAVDSHSQFATSAGLRLDSYIFTIEFFEQVRRHLAKEGVFVLEFSGFHWYSVPWARERLSEILWRVFGFDAKEDTPIGAGGPQFVIRPKTRPPADRYNRAVKISTDDWPHFYLRSPFIPRAYKQVILGVLVLSLLGVCFAKPKGLRQFEGHFFFLGAGFMLLEIKSISELSLAFGATWLVSSLVIAAILLAIGAATIIVLRWGAAPYYVGYAIVFGSLGINILLGPRAFLSLGFTLRAVLACAKVALPVLGAGLVFASSFRRTQIPSVALGWNLLGAMVGGLGEYLSMITGVSALGVYIVILYLLSLLMLRSKRMAPSLVEGGSC